MKTISTLRTITVTLSLAFLISQSSCVVVQSKHDNGKHKGWNKNPNNPHHLNSTNPGKNKAKTNGNSKGKSKK